jgi:hypothetical protein
MKEIQKYHNAKQLHQAHLDQQNLTSPFKQKSRPVLLEEPSSPTISLKVSPSNLDLMNSSPSASTFILPKATLPPPQNNNNPSLMILGPRNFSLAPSVVFEPRKPKPKPAPEIRPPQAKIPHDHKRNKKPRESPPQERSITKTVNSIHSSQVKLAEWQNIDVVTDLGANISQIGDTKKSTSLIKGIGSRSKLSQYYLHKSPQRASNLDLNIPLLDKNVPPRERSRAENQILHLTYSQSEKQLQLGTIEIEEAEDVEDNNLPHEDEVNKSEN